MRLDGSLHFTAAGRDFSTVSNVPMKNFRSLFFHCISVLLRDNSPQRSGDAEVVSLGKGASEQGANSLDSASVVRQQRK